MKRDTERAQSSLVELGTASEEIGFGDPASGESRTACQRSRDAIQMAATIRPTPAAMDSGAIRRTSHSGTAFDYQMA